MMLPVTALYAGLLGLGFLLLSVRVIRARGAHGVALGTGGQQTLERAIRAHGNFAEYVPFALLILVLLEANGVPAWALHLLGLALLAGRALHAWNIAREAEVLRLRVAGMALTFVVLGVGAVALLSLAVARL
jgi:uncharacterized membrane protein YecN with MAPEG domain